MRILYLGRESSVSAFLREHATVLQTAERLNTDALEGTDWIVSYNYGFLLRRQQLESVERRAVNLHYSLLPWNRGTFPNLWSWLEGTPKGVTIHQIDPGMDTGPVYVQQEITSWEVAPRTLRTTHAQLSATLESLFVRHWPSIHSGELLPRPQTGKGTVHRDRDKACVEHILTQGWDTPTERVEEAGLRWPGRRFPG